MSHKPQISNQTSDASVERRWMDVAVPQLSNELKNPLNAILGLTELLAQEESLSDDARRWIFSIREASEQLSDLVEAAEIEEGVAMPHEEVFELRPLLRDVISLFEDLAKAKGLTLTLSISSDTPTHILSDSLKTWKILTRVMGNAVKCTQHGGVLLMVSARHPRNDYCELEFQVLDTGPGMSTEEMSQVFEPFARDSNPADQRDGGLGLAISKHYAQLLGGDLTVLSRLGRGSVFRLNLPVVWLHFDSSAAEGMSDPSFSGESRESGTFRKSGGPFPRLRQTPPP